VCVRVCESVHTLHFLSRAIASPSASGNIDMQSMQMSPSRSAHLGFFRVPIRGGMANHIRKHMKNAKAENLVATAGQRAGQGGRHGQ